MLPGTPVRIASAVLTGLLLTSSLSGCSSENKGASTSCSQFAEMGPHTGLMTQANDAQTKVIESMLKAHDKSTGAYNVTIATGQIVAYCNIYEGQSGSHQDEMVDNIFASK